MPDKIPESLKTTRFALHALRVSPTARSLRSFIDENEALTPDELRARYAWPVFLSSPTLNAQAWDLSIVLHAAPKRATDTVARIGRGEENDLVFADPSVSKKHATLRRSGSDWLLTDEGSSNGTLVDDRRLERGKPVRLRSLAAVGFGLAPGLVFFGPDDIVDFVGRAKKVTRTRV